MIRVDRGAEPPELAPIRAAELARVEAIVAVRPLESKDFGSSYKGTSRDPELFRRLLNEAQHGKCCYCEVKHPSTRRDLEHFRPKSEAVGSDGVTRRPAWWWLAWTWENLLFACDHCNRNHKNARFGLRDESKRMLPKDAPPGPEDPLLLDPGSAAINPLDHIQFKRLASGDWWPVPKNGSVYGAYTIEVCGLTRPALRDQYRCQHDMLAPTIRSVEDELRRADDANECGDPAPLEQQRARWDRLLGAHFQRSMPLTALTVDIYDHYFPQTLREAYGLSWPRP